MKCILYISKPIHTETTFFAMKSLFSILFLVVSFISITGQNLVPNPSFEDHSGCPKTTDQFGYCVDWLNFRNTPDYFNSCSDFMGVPLNIAGFQQAKDGEAYAGISCYWTVNVDSREHIGIELLEPMETGTTYYASFWISKSDLPLSDVACNNQGIRFSTNLFTNGDSTPLPNWDHVHNQEVVTDSIGWTQIKGAFTADSNYLYMSIGNFFNDVNTDTIHLNSVASGEGYYYVDDVKLSTDSSFVYEMGIHGEHEKLSILVYPNPCSDYLFVESNSMTVSVTLRSITGELLLERNERNPNFLMDMLDVSPGCYILELKAKNGCCYSKTIIKTE